MYLHLYFQQNCRYMQLFHVTHTHTLMSQAGVPSIRENYFSSTLSHHPSDVSIFETFSKLSDIDLSPISLSLSLLSITHSITLIPRLSMFFFIYKSLCSRPSPPNTSALSFPLLLYTNLHLFLQVMLLSFPLSIDF